MWQLRLWWWSVLFFWHINGRSSNRLYALKSCVQEFSVIISNLCGRLHSVLRKCLPNVFVIPLAIYLFQCSPDFFSLPPLSGTNTCLECLRYKNKHPWVPNACFWESTDPSRPYNFLLKIEHCKWSMSVTWKCRVSVTSQTHSSTSSSDFLKHSCLDPLQ